MQQNKNEELLKNKEKNIIIIGFIAILLILLLTIFKSLVFSGNNLAAKKNTSSLDVQKNAYQIISVDELKQKISSKEEITLLDIRSFNEYIKEHLIGAINVPAEEISSSNKLIGNNTIVIIGNDDQDSNIEKAALEIKKINFSPVVLAGGISNWKNKGGLTISFGDPTSIVDQAKVTYLEIEKAKEALNENPEIVVIDVRDNSQFVNGHLKNAKNIPILDIEKRKSELFATQNIFVLGSNEIQAFQAAVQIYDLTLKKPVVVKGSMPKWEELKYEIVK
jgi:rhodanese-related sulfurtransferase